MKLWLIKRIEEDDAHYGETIGLVIRAEDEQSARQMAGDYGEDFGGREPWLSPEKTECEIITEDGEPGIILEDNKGA